MAAMILSGSETHSKGLEWALWCSRNRLIAVWRSTTERETPRLRRRLVSGAKKPSTALSQEVEVTSRTSSARGIAVPARSAVGDRDRQAAGVRPCRAPSVATHSPFSPSDRRSPCPTLRAGCQRRDASSSTPRSKGLGTVLPQLPAKVRNFSLKSRNLASQRGDQFLDFAGRSMPPSIQIRCPPSRKINQTTAFSNQL